MREKDGVPYTITFSGTVPSKKARKVIKVLTQTGLSEGKLTNRDIPQVLDVLGRLGTDQMVDMKIGSVAFASSFPEADKRPSEIVSRKQYFAMGERQNYGRTVTSKSWNILAGEFQNAIKGVNPDFPVKFQQYPENANFGPWTNGQVNNLEVNSLKIITDQYQEKASYEGVQLTATALAGPSARPKHFDLWGGIVKEVLGNIDTSTAIE